MPTELCPECSTALFLREAPISIENDDTPELETIVWQNQVLCCRNPKCRRFEDVIETVKTRIS